MPIAHTLIMAAGRGTRMMPLTTNIPKAMAKLGDTTLIANSIGKLKKSGLNIHITVGYKGAKLAQHVIQHGVNSILNTEGKGNAWWIFNTLMKNLDEPVLVLTCDNVVELDLHLIYRDYEQFGHPACMVVPVKPVPGLAGDYIFHENHCITELNRNKPSDIYCSGIQVLNPKKINTMVPGGTEDFYDVWRALIDQQQLYSATTYPLKWFTVDTIEQLNQINAAGF
jgi:NDP-sugar pyrophosphorylase family protein